MLMNIYACDSFSISRCGAIKSYCVVVATHVHDCDLQFITIHGLFVSVSLSTWVCECVIFMYVSLSFLSVCECVIINASLFVRVYISC